MSKAGNNVSHYLKSARADLDGAGVTEHSRLMRVIFPLANHLFKSTSN